MGEAALAASADAVEITLALPNRHHLLVDLAPFRLDNPNEIFVATDQPFGLIEATVTRSPA
jgi:urate oxidase